MLRNDLYVKAMPQTGLICLMNDCCAVWCRQSAIRELQLLEADDWTDQYTRAVFTEFTLFHTQSTLFSSVKLALEISPLGLARTSLQVASVFLYKYTSTMDYAVLVAEVRVAWFLYFLVRSCNRCT